MKVIRNETLTKNLYNGHIESGSLAAVDEYGRLVVNSSTTTSPLPTDAATETKQDTIISHVDQVETKLDTIIAQQLPDGHNVTVDNTTPIPISDNGGSITVDGTVNVTGVATEATLSSIDSKDFATETTLASLNTKDFATSAKQDTIISSLNTLTTKQTRTNIVHATTTLSTTTETTILTAGGAGIYHDITLLVISNTSNDSVRVDIRDATAGTIRWSVGLSPKGGAVIPFSASLTQTTANNNWTAQLDTAVTDVRVNVVAVRES